MFRISDAGKKWEGMSGCEVVWPILLLKVFVSKAKLGPKLLKPADGGASFTEDARSGWYRWSEAKNQIETRELASPGIQFAR